MIETTTINSDHIYAIYVENVAVKNFRENNILSKVKNIIL